MRLQTKFAVLLGLLAVMVCTTIGVSVWAVLMLQREVSAPFASTTVALDVFAAIKSELTVQTSILSAGDAPGNDRLAASRDRITHDMTRLRAIATLHRQSGISTSRNLAARLEQSQRLVGDVIAGSADAQACEEAMASLASADMLIRLIEARVLADAEIAIAYGERLRARLMRIVAAAVGGTLLVGLLGLLLLRRWVILPVAKLRVATAEIGSGNLSYRLPATGRDEISALSREINHMSETIAHMQRERLEQERVTATGEMLRRVAHNLRNPLAGIRSLAELTKVDIPGEAELRETQQRIIASVDRLEQWLAELLEASSPLSIEPAEHSVQSWLEGIVASHEPLARGKRVQLVLAPDVAPHRATFDRMHLEHAVVALVTNAIQVSPAGGIVELAAQAGQDGGGGGWWEVRVSDQGPGVDEGLRERIFAPYFTTKRQGNGIGLAVAQKVVRGHGGEISVHCPSRGGAEFVIRLPVEPSAQVSDPEAME